MFVSAQSAADSVCRANIEKIFKVADLKVKYEAIEYFYHRSREKNSFITVRLKEDRHGRHFEEITGAPLDSGEHKDSIFVQIYMEDSVKQTYYTPRKAMQEYRDFIQDIKSEKETYLKCIDTALSKDSSEYAGKITSYHYRNRLWSIILHLEFVTQLDHLRIFKEFILNGNEEILPDDTRVVAYLKCGCKVPFYLPSLQIYTNQN